MISAGVYVVPVIDPPPETIDQVPPAGVPVNVLVCPSVISAVEVVLFATKSQTGVTSKVTNYRWTAAKFSKKKIVLI